MSSDQTSREHLEEMARKSLRHSVAYLMALNDLLADESERTLDISQSKTENMVGGAVDFKEQQFWFRVMVRSFFAHVEGTTFAMRRIVIWSYERNECVLEPEEIMVLREEHGVFEKGRIKTVEKYNRFLDNIQITFLFFPRLFHTSFQLPTGDHRWESFRRAVMLRDRITHPKRPFDLFIEYNEMQQVLDAMRWFADCMSAVFVKCDLQNYKTKE